MSFWLCQVKPYEAPNETYKFQREIIIYCIPTSPYRLIKSYKVTKYVRHMKKAEEYNGRKVVYCNNQDEGISLTRSVLLFFFCLWSSDRNA